MQLKEILFKEEIEQTFVIMSQLHVKLEKEHYCQEILNMFHEGYKMAAIFDEQEICIALIALRVIRRIGLEKTIEIEDFMIDHAKRNLGAGEKLLEWVDGQAKNFGCKNIIVDIKTYRKESQAIFARQKYIIDGLCMKKSCD